MMMTRETLISVLTSKVVSSAVKFSTLLRFKTQYNLTAGQLAEFLEIFERGLKGSK